ncbi:MAG: hypothetical protein ACK5ND_09985 [Bacteroides sp.]
MGLFNSNMRKPRRFNHQYIYVDERKEKLNEMEEKAKRDLGMLPEKEFSPEDIRGKFVEGTTHLKRRKASGKKPISVGIIILIIILLGLLWHYLQTGSWSF